MRVELPRGAAGPPSVCRRSLVVWAGPHSGVDVARLARDVVGAVAAPLRRAAADAGLLEQARAAGLGVALPGEAHLNQLPPAARGPGFAQLPYAQPAALDVEGARFSEQALADYAEPFLDAQLAAGATIVTTPAHVVARELGHGREQDLALAEASVAAWRERQAWRPPPQRPDDPPRQLHAAIAVRGRDLAGAADGLVERYAQLAVDGYWIVVFDADDSAAQLAGATDLCLGLQERSGRPATIAGIAAMHEALLASGVAAACVGLRALRPSFPPGPDEADEVTGIAVPAFHPAILGALPAGARHDEVRARLFAEHPCRCGEHPAAEPPRGRRAANAHNAWCLAAEARDATRLTPVLDEARLAKRVVRANVLRTRLGLAPLRPGWVAVAAAARARRAAVAQAAAGATGRSVA